MKKENKNVVFCPPCGENVGLPTKRGFLNKATSFTTPLPACGVLPPQGGQMTAHGFTLIELLVVVLIIGILAAIAVPQYQTAVDKSRYIELMSLVKNVQEMQDLYFLINGSHATDCEELGIDLPSGAILSSAKNIFNEKKDYLISCNWNGNRASGQFRSFGGGTLAYERRFSHTDIPGLTSCFAASTSKRAQRVCKTFCGPLATDAAGNKICRFSGTYAGDNFDEE